MTPPLGRRSTALTAVALSVALALTACGDDDDADTATDTATDTTAETAADTTAGATGDTRTVEADNGTIEVPAAPQRVVTLGNTSQPYVDLGGQPLGVSPYYAFDLLPADQQATFEAATDIGGDEVDLELIASLEPDLILVQIDDPTFEQIEEQLQAIAPTVFWDLDTEWKEFAAAIADASGLTGSLDAQQAEYEELVTGIQDRYAEIIETTSFVDVSRGDWSDPGTFYIADIGCSEIARDDVGMDFPEAPEGEDPLAYASLPFEQLASLAEYDVITYPVDAEGQPTEPFAEVVETNTWQALPAVTSGRALGVSCPGNGSYGQVNRYLASLDSALATLQAEG